MGADHEFLGWFQLALGMAEFRLGHYRAADQGLIAARQTAPVNSGFFRSMCLYKEGQAAEARRLFAATVSRMPPLPERSN